MEEYKPNSFKSKEDARIAKREPVVKAAPVVQQKRSTVVDALTKIKDYVISDVKTYFISTLKRTVSDVINNSVDIFLYGDSRNNRKNYTNHDNASWRYYYESERRPDPYYSSYGRPNSYNRAPVPHFDGNLFFPEKNYENLKEAQDDAERVLFDMKDALHRYGLVSVATMKESAKMSGEYTDNDFGWTDLSKAYVGTVRDGVVLYLPKVMELV